MINTSLKTLSPTYYTRIKEVSKRVPACKRLLDAGCSDGYLDYIIRDKAEEIYGIDINKTDVEIAKILNPKNKYSITSIYELPYKNSYFDLILCLDVIEHLRNDDRAIKELKRTLKKKGKIIFTVPSKDYPLFFDPINYILNFFNKHLPFGMWSFGHLRLYSMEKLSKKLKKQGFRIIDKAYLSHSIIGLVENSYLINIAQPFTKSDPLNKAKQKKTIDKLKKRLTSKPPFLLTLIRDFFLFIDKLFFKNSKVSINILIVAEKER